VLRRHGLILHQGFVLKVESELGCTGRSWISIFPMEDALAARLVVDVITLIPIATIPLRTTVIIWEVQSHLESAPS